MALHIIDTAMVGALGYKQLAAAALGVICAEYSFRYRNRNDDLRFATGVYGAWKIRCPKGLSLLLQWFLDMCIYCRHHLVGSCSGKDILFHLGQDPEVAAFAVPFLTLMSWSIIPMLLFMALKQFTDD